MIIKSLPCKLYCHRKNVHPKTHAVVEGFNSSLEVLVNKFL